MNSSYGDYDDWGLGWYLVELATDPNEKFHLSCHDVGRKVIIMTKEDGPVERVTPSSEIGPLRGTQYLPTGEDARRGGRSVSLSRKGFLCLFLSTTGEKS